MDSVDRMMSAHMLADIAEQEVPDWQPLELSLKSWPTS